MSTEPAHPTPPQPGPSPDVVAPAEPGPTPASPTALRSFASFMRTGFDPADAEMVARKFETAADEIERLRAALRPFARMSGLYEHWQDDTVVRQSVTAGDVRHARAALSPK